MLNSICGLAARLLEQFAAASQIDDVDMAETVKEALIKSTCADLRQEFLLARKKNAGILADFKFF